jgi:DNA-binding beta-propeller fold protein YncE
MQSFQQMLRVEDLESSENMTFGFDGRNLYVVEQSKKRISVIEMYARKKVAEIDLGGPSDPAAEVSAISRSADGFTGFVSVTSENRVVVIDLVDWMVKASIQVGGGPVRPFSPADNRYVLIPHRNAKALTVLSALSHEVITTIETGVAAKGLNTGWLDTVAFVMPATGNKIAVVDLDKLLLTGTIELPGQPDDGLVTSDSRKLFTALLDSGSIASIDTRSRSLSAVIQTSNNHLRGIGIAVSNNICH